MQTAIYCRVSTEEQATEGFSIHAQKDKLTKYAESNDWDIVDYYVDDGISGKNLTDRKEVSRLIEDVKKGKINNVFQSVSDAKVYSGNKSHKEIIIM